MKSSHSKALEKAKGGKKISVIERKNKNFSYEISDHKGKLIKKGQYND